MRDTVPRAAALALVAAVLALGRLTHAHAEGAPRAGSEVFAAHAAECHGVPEGRDEAGLAVRRGGHCRAWFHER
jgi:mono/diheme cytochrome c family protein